MIPKHVVPMLVSLVAFAAGLGVAELGHVHADGGGVSPQLVERLVRAQEAQAQRLEQLVRATEKCNQRR